MRMVLSGILAFGLTVSSSIWAMSWATPPTPPVYCDVKGQGVVIARGETISFHVSCTKSQGEPDQGIRLRVDIEVYKPMSPQAKAEDVVVEPRRFTLKPGSGPNALQEVSVKVKGDGWFMVKVFAENAPYQKSNEPIQTYFIISDGKEVSFTGGDFSICHWQSLLKKYGLPLEFKKNQLPADKADQILQEYDAWRRDRRVAEDRRQEAKALVKKYIGDKWDGVTMDWISPYYFQIADMGADAVPALLDALASEDPAYVEERTSFVYLLGMIGNQDAYDALRAWFVSQSKKTARWRAAISLGACLTVALVDDYVSLVVTDTTGGGLQALREMSGKDFGTEVSSWAGHLKNEWNLRKFRENCRKRSAPILG